MRRSFIAIAFVSLAAACSDMTAPTSTRSSEAAAPVRATIGNLYTFFGSCGQGVLSGTVTQVGSSNLMTSLADGGTWAFDSTAWKGKLPSASKPYDAFIQVLNYQVNHPDGSWDRETLRSWIVTPRFAGGKKETRKEHEFTFSSGSPVVLTPVIECSTSY